MDKPKFPCWRCFSNDWWLRDKEWVCGGCHPNPNKEQVED